MRSLATAGAGNTAAGPVQLGLFDVVPAAAPSPTPAPRPVLAAALELAGPRLVLVPALPAPAPAAEEAVTAVFIPELPAPRSRRRTPVVLEAPRVLCQLEGAPRFGWVVRWDVSGGTPDMTYRVGRQADGVTYGCSCRGWTLNVPRPECKHIRAVRSQEAAAEASVPAPLLPTPPLPPSTPGFAA